MGVMSYQRLRLPPNRRVTKHKTISLSVIVNDLQLLSLKQENIEVIPENANEEEKEPPQIKQNVLGIGEKMKKKKRVNKKGDSEREIIQRDI